MGVKTVIGFITFPDEDEAGKAAEKLLDKKLVACCNLVPEIESIYRWKGKVKEGEEVLLMVKTRADLKEKVIKAIEKIHPYDVPVIEFIETELNKKAVEWIERETKK